MPTNCDFNHTITRYAKITYAYAIPTPKHPPRYSIPGALAIVSTPEKREVCNVKSSLLIFIDDLVLLTTSFLHHSSFFLSD